MMKSRSLLVGAAIAATIGAAGSAGAATAFIVRPTFDSRDGSWSLGEVFTVGSSPITVTALGAYDAGGDGFVTPGGLPVGIFRESDRVLLASTTVQSSDPFRALYRYHTITPLTLLANTTYRVVAVNEEDLYATSTKLSVNRAITHNSYGYCNTTVLTLCNDFTGNENVFGVFMANFHFGVGSIPEPESWVTILIGLVAIGGALRTARRKTGKAVAAA
jgi:hypothetical protein